MLHLLPPADRLEHRIQQRSKVACLHLKSKPHMRCTYLLRCSGQHISTSVVQQPWWPGGAHLAEPVSTHYVGIDAWHKLLRCALPDTCQYPAAHAYATAPHRATSILAAILMRFFAHYLNCWCACMQPAAQHPSRAQHRPNLCAHANCPHHSSTSKTS